MPTYEYVCDACDHEFELFQQMSDSPKKKCPDCGKQKLRRLFGTGAAVMFKGSGFYETDYRSKSYKDGAKKAKKKTDESKSTKSEKSDSKKSDSTSKPAAKKDSGK